MESITAIDPVGAGSSNLLLEAGVLDLEGVLTDTASLHQSAWQRLFDQVLRPYATAAPFTEADYLRYIDGRRRTEGGSCARLPRHRASARRS